MKRKKTRLKLALLVVISLSASAAQAAFVNFADVKAHYVRSEAVVYDRKGRVLHESRVDLQFRRLAWVELAQVSQAFAEAVVRSEDRDFWTHGGVDWKALGRSALSNLMAGRRKRGASTISMQLASILEKDIAPQVHSRRTVFQKWMQVRSAMELEQSWSKAQILEAYFNLVSFRGDLQGIGTASEGLFGKAPHGLDLNEALILAALIRAPGASPAQIQSRACQLGLLMKAGGFDCGELERRLSKTHLIDRWIRPQIALAPHVAAQLFKASGGKSVRSTLDRELQGFALESLRSHLLSARPNNAHDAALLVLDNRSGQVLAYVGGLNELSSAHYVDGVRALRQAGSTLKPFLYGIALERRYLTVASRMDDTPADIAVAGGVYRPRNYDNEFHGRDIPLSTALASSLNVPAVRTLDLIGVHALLQRMEQLGFSSLREPEYYGPSLALGAADISLWELVNAYRTLANGGRWTEVSMRADAVNSKVSKKHVRQVYSAEAAFLVSDILSDRESRSLTFGLENSLSSRFWTAVKTGTSKDMRDNWCVGYSERFTVGVWVGNYSGEPMWNVSGITGAAPTWAEVMNWLHEHEPSRPPAQPSGLVQAKVDGRSRWFIAGTEPSEILRLEVAAESRAGASSHITYPSAGMVIARDPDIPSDQQRLFFEAAPGSRGLHWELNGRVVEPDGSAGWKPELGNHELVLRNQSGARVDSVRFSVRGG